MWSGLEDLGAATTARARKFWIRWRWFNWI